MPPLFWSGGATRKRRSPEVFIWKLKFHHRLSHVTKDEIAKKVIARHQFATWLTKQLIFWHRVFLWTIHKGQHFVLISHALRKIDWRRELYIYLFLDEYRLLVLVFVLVMLAVFVTGCVCVCECRVFRRLLLARVQLPGLHKEICR